MSNVIPQKPHKPHKKTGPGTGTHGSPGTGGHGVHKPHGPTGTVAGAAADGSLASLYFNQIAVGVKTPTVGGGGGDAGPIAPSALPAGSLGVFAVPVAEINQIGDGVIKVHVDMDATTLTDGQRQLVINPNTTSATLVARAQITAMTVDPDTAKAAAFDPLQVAGFVGKHDALRQQSHVSAVFLDAVGGAKLVVQVDRSLARDKVKAHVVDTLGTILPDDPQRVRYQAALSHIEAAEAKVMASVQTKQDTNAKARENAVARVNLAEADLQLAEVLHDLRRDIQPDPAKMAAAAQHLKEQEALGRRF